MRHLLFVLLLSWVVGLASGVCHAAPIIWETDLGDELEGLSGADDNTQAVALGFAFPLLGASYSSLFVSANGFISLGADAGLSHAPQVATLLNSVSPVVAPFWSDLDLSLTGAVWFNDFGDRAAVTWQKIGAFGNPLAEFTFQVQLFEDGRILLGYDGIPDLEDTLDENLIVGLHVGENALGTLPTDYTNHTQANGMLQTLLEGTTYEWFDPKTDGFDLDGATLLFSPVPVSVPPLQFRPAMPTMSFSPAMPQPAPNAAIPEPHSLVLLGIALCAVVAWRRKAGIRG